MDGSPGKHRWPIRRYLEPAERVGMTTEPAGHDEDGRPLYSVYVSKGQQKLILTEPEILELISDLANPNRWLYE